MSNGRLLDQGCTCVILQDGEVIFRSSDRGIKPLLYIIESGIGVKGCKAFDRIVGKAAAMLYSYMGVAYVYAEVMSRPGLEVLKKHGIRAEYDALTDKIINRRGDGICPMERTVADIDSLESALVALQSKSRELNKG